MNDEDLSCLRFFLGGFGDARHLLASLIDLHAQAIELSDEKRSRLHVTFMLNDIKIHAVSKLCLLLSSLERLAKFERSQLLEEHETFDPEALRAAALVVYVYVGNVMPVDIHDQLISLIKTLTREDKSKQPSELAWENRIELVDLDNWADIVKVFIFYNL